MIILQPVTLIPTQPARYIPSRLRRSLQVSYAEFVSRFADNAAALLYAPDEASDPQPVTGYGRRWIVHKVEAETLKGKQ